MTSGFALDPLGTLSGPQTPRPIILYRPFLIPGYGPAKFGWNWPRGSGEEDEYMWKVYNDYATTDNVRKAPSFFGLGELKLFENFSTKIFKIT